MQVRDGDAERKDAHSSDDAASSEMQSLINNTAVLGLAWDNAGTQLVAVVGQYEVHIWSLGMERCKGFLLFCSYTELSHPSFVF